MATVGILRIPAYLLDRIGAHARSEHPREVCGFLTGPPGGLPEQFVPIPNVASAPETAYVMDENAVLAAFTHMDQVGHDPLVIYHSHTHAEPTMSPVDVAYARLGDPVHLICSTQRSLAAPTFQAWHVMLGGDDGTTFVPEQVAMDIIDAAHPESPLAGLIEGNRVRLTYDGVGGRRTVVATVGRHSGESVTLFPVRPGASGHMLTISLDRVRAVGVLSEGSSAASTRAAAVHCLTEAATRLAAQDTVGAREAVARAGALMPRLIPTPPPVPRAYRPRRRGE